VPAGGDRRHPRAGGAASAAKSCPRSPERHRAAAPRRSDRRGALHPDAPLCIQACPVDAIVGASKLMHTVVTELCSGMRPVRRALPRGLHRHGARDGRGRAWGADREHAAREAPRAAPVAQERERRERTERLAARALSAKQDPGAEKKRVAISAAIGARAGAEAGSGRDPQKTPEDFRAAARGNPHPTTELAHRTPFELLVSVVLSAQATDKSVNLATEKLYRVGRHFRRPCSPWAWRIDRAYPHDRPVIAPRRSNILETCRLLVERHGGKVPESREALEALPGVGRKTAKRDPQHRLRASDHRGGYAHLSPRQPHRPRCGQGRSQVEDRLLKFVPEEFRKDAHHWLILHGRYVCKARKPECPACIIRDLCEFKQKTKA